MSDLGFPGKTRVLVVGFFSTLRGVLIEGGFGRISVKHALNPDFSGPSAALKIWWKTRVLCNSRVRVPRHQQCMKLLSAHVSDLTVTSTSVSKVYWFVVARKFGHVGFPSTCTCLTNVCLPLRTPSITGKIRQTDATGLLPDCTLRSPLSPGHPPGNSLAIISNVTRYRGGSETDSGA